MNSAWWNWIQCSQSVLLVSLSVKIDPPSSKDTKHVYNEPLILVKVYIEDWIGSDKAYTYYTYITLFSNSLLG